MTMTGGDLANSMLLLQGIGVLHVAMLLQQQLLQDMIREWSISVQGCGPFAKQWLQEEVSTWVVWWFVVGCLCFVM